MPKPSNWTREQKAEALALHRDHGPAEAARRTGIPKPTIASWARRAGVHSDATDGAERTRVARRAAEEAWATRRARLADKMGQLAETLADRAFDADESRDAKQLVEAAEKAGGMAQLLTGGATGRVEHEHQDVGTPQGRLAAVHTLRGQVQRRTERAEEQGATG